MKKPSFAEIWKRILACESEEFETTTSLLFTYEVRGDYLIPSRTEYKISKSDIAKAYAKVPLSDPGEITKLVGGPAMFMRSFTMSEYRSMNCRIVAVKSSNLLSESAITKLLECEQQ